MIAEDLSTKIGVYDQNTPSVLTEFYLEAQNEGVEMYHADNLNSLKGMEKIIINPSCIIYKEHWKNIGQFIKNNPESEILFVAPDNLPEEIREFIGIPKNVEYIATSEKQMNWERLYSLIGGKK